MATSVNDFLKQNPTYIGRTNTANQTKASKKQTGHGGILSSLISELSGTGGAVGGAAAGAAAGSIVPGLGTVIGGLIGAGLGGFAGGTVGRGVENKVRDNQNFFGKGGSASAALKEGALTGALSAIPLGGAGKVVRNVGKVTEGRVGGNAVQEAGQRLESRAAGYGQGTKLPNGSRLTYSQVQKMKALDQAEKIPAGHPDVQGKVIERRLGEANSQLDSAIQTGNRRFTASEKAKLNEALTKGIKSNVAVARDPNVLREIDQLSSGFKGIRTVKQAVKAKRDIQREVNFNRNSASAVPGKEQANRVALKALDDVINASHPEIGQANKRVSGLITRLDLSGTESSTLKNQANNGGGLMGKVLTGDSATSAKSRIGNILQKAGTTASTAPEILSKGTLVKELAKQTAGRQVFGGGLQVPQTEEQVMPSQDLVGAQAMQDPQVQQPQAEPPYSLQAALADIQRDPKHTSDYLNLYKTVSGASGSTSKPLGASQQQQATNAQSGLQSIQDLSNFIQTDPSVINKSSVPGQGSLVGGFLSNKLGTGEYNAAASNIKDVISRLRSGAALTVQEEKRYTNLIPKAGDSDSTIQYKLNSLAELFQKFAYPQAGVDDSNLSGALAQLGG